MKKLIYILPLLFLAQISIGQVIPQKIIVLDAGGSGGSGNTKYVKQGTYTKVDSAGNVYTVSVDTTKLKDSIFAKAPLKALGDTLTLNTDTIPVRLNYVGVSTGMLSANSLIPKSYVDSLSKSGLITLLKSDSTYWIRTKFTDTTDIVQQVTYKYDIVGNANKMFDFIAAYIVNSNIPNDSTDYVSGTQIQDNSDDGAPIQTYENGYIGEGHGALLTSVYSSGTDKTSSDIGSRWTDGTNEYYLVKIYSDTLVFYVKINLGGSYSYRTFATITGSSLTSDSGAVHTTTINFSSQFYTQQYPVVNNILQSVTLDGNTITANGIYKGSSLYFKNNYDIADISSLPITNPFSFNNAPAFVSVSLNYLYNPNGSCIISHILNFKRNKYISDFGGVQMIKLKTSTPYPNIYNYMPDVKPIGGYDYANIVQTNTTPPLANFDSTFRVKSVIPPDRDIQLLGNSTNKFLGFAEGYFPDLENSADSIRKNNTNDWMISAAGKSYPYIIYNKQADSTLILTSYSFRNFFPINNDILTYYNKLGTSYYLYIETHKKLTNQVISIPTELKGLNFSIYRKSDSISVISQTNIPPSGLIISATGNGYCILKLNTQPLAPASIDTSLFVHKAGTGTTNYLPKWNGANSITNSLIYDNGTNVGIGAPSPIKLLSVGAANNFTVDLNGNVSVGRPNVSSSTPSQLYFQEYQPSGTGSPSIVINGENTYMGWGVADASGNHLRMGAGTRVWPTFGTVSFNLAIDGGLSVGTSNIAPTNSILVGGKVMTVTNPTMTLADSLTLTNKKYVDSAVVSKGVSGQTTLVAGTKSITVAGVTTSSTATLGFVSLGGTVSTTWQYAVVCTTNTVTITALTNTGTTDASDTSTLNYSVTY